MASPSPSPFTITVYDKAMAKRGTVGAVQALTVTVRHNQQGNAQLVLPATAPRLFDLMAEGARVVVTYRGDFLMSGPVVSYSGAGPRDTSTFTFQILDDWELLTRTLAWPVPGAVIGSQSAAEYDTRTGAAETVFKSVVSANLPHSVFTGAIPVTVATSLGRGPSITVRNRFHSISERTIPLLDLYRVGTTVKQVGSGLVVDCYASRTYPRTLTEASGIVQDWTYSSSRRTATRVIVGGKGDGTARQFTEVGDPTSDLALRYRIEAFLDATDVANGAEAADRGADFISLHSTVQNGLAVTLSETSSFRYDPSGVEGIRVGDLIQFEVGPGVVILDVLRSATLNWSSDKGLEVTPQVGDRKDDPAISLALTVAALRRTINNMRR